MKRTTLRTSAIALGVAAAMPATAQEWNLKWSGFMEQHFAFGSTDTKTTVSVNDLSYSFDGEQTRSGEDVKYKGTVHFVATAGDAPSGAVEILSTAPSAIDWKQTGDTPANFPTAVFQTAANARRGDDGNQDTFYVVVGPTTYDAEGVASNTGLYGILHTKADEVSKAVDMSGASQRRNSEVHFKPSVTLENGLTFGAVIELEGDNDHGVDRSYMNISSDSLGKITLGSHPSMGYGMMWGAVAPNVGLSINSGAHTNFIPVKADGAAYSSANEVGGNWEVMRVSYMTPSLGGLTVGVSYAASSKAAVEGNAIDKNGVAIKDGVEGGNKSNHSGFLKAKEKKGDLSDIMDIGASFTQSMGEMNFTLAARYGTAQLEGYDKKPRETAVGATVSFGAFTVGGAYADSQRPAGKDSEGWSLGASYAMDAWTFGIETYQGEYDNGDDHSASKIAARRNLGPGVVWDIYAVTAESTTTDASLTVGDSALTLANPAKGTKLDSTGTSKGSGTIFGTSINLNF